MENQANVIVIMSEALKNKSKRRESQQLDVNHPLYHNLEYKVPRIKNKIFGALELPYGLLVLCSTLGVLLRMALLTIRTGEIASVVFPNMLGCFVMGYLTTQENFFLAHNPRMWLALSSGLCGSITSFSGFASALYVSFGALKSKGFLLDILEGVASIIAMFGLCDAAFSLGKQIALLGPLEVTLTDKAKLYLDSYICIGMSVLIITIPIILVFFMDWRVMLLSNILAPFGSIIRILFSKLNGKFPYGTLISNLLASSILFLCVISYGNMLNLNCVLVQAIRMGFCGTLSTMSTFMWQLRKMHTKLAWKYAFISTFAAELIAVLIIGSYKWSGNKLLTACTL
jgi:CrcB protein